MNFKTKLKEVYHKLIKDADFEKLPDEEKVDKLVEAGSDAIEELPPEKKEVSEEGEVTIAQLNETVNRLIGIIEAFVKSASAIGEGLEKKIEDEDLEKEKEDEYLKEETEDEDLEEEKEEREKMEAKDCDSVWYDVAYRADLLSPGMRLNKPTKDHKSILTSIKKAALKSCFTTDSEIASKILKKDKIDSLSVDAIDIAFIAASDAIKNKNNKMVTDSISMSAKTVTNDIRSIQERNKKFWGRK